MGAKQRAAAAAKARILGAIARRAGHPQSANPYKRDGSWSLHPAWWAGWMEEDNILNAELPPWLLSAQDATFIANTHRVRLGTVQAVAKAVYKVFLDQGAKQKKEG